MLVRAQDAVSLRNCVWFLSRARDLAQEGRPKQFRLQPRALAWHPSPDVISGILDSLRLRANGCASGARAQKGRTNDARRHFRLASEKLRWEASTC